MLKINNNINNDDETIENNIVTEKDTCIIYSDGSYNKLTNKCGYASYIIESNNTKIKCGSFIMEHGGRNIEGEIAAIINTINELTLNKNSNFKNIIIYYDYEGIEKWATGSWNATTIYTQAYAKAMKSIINKFNVKFIHIKSHTGNIESELNTVEDVINYYLAIENKDLIVEIQDKSEFLLRLSVIKSNGKLSIEKSLLKSKPINYTKTSHRLVITI